MSRFTQVQEACRRGASDAAERIGPAARQARHVTADRMLVARGWGAPRLRRAARYVEVDLSPRVSSMLSQAAHRVEPPKRARRGRTVMLTMLAAVSAVGLGAAVLARRGNGRTGAAETADEYPVPAPAPTGVDGQVHAH